MYFWAGAASMNEFFSLGKVLIIIGLIVAVLGLLLVLAGKGFLPWIGRLPGDLYFKGKNFSVYFPLATSILISVVVTAILWLIHRR
jgi:hypothetical protein